MVCVGMDEFEFGSANACVRESEAVCVEGVKESGYLCLSLAVCVYVRCKLSGV
jgi:uncharacterized ferredoxin-like protein